MGKDEFYIWDFEEMTYSKGISNRKNNHHHISKMQDSWSLSFFKLAKVRPKKYRAIEKQTEKAKSAALSPGFKIRIKAGTLAAAAAGATGTAVQSMWGIFPVSGPGLQIIFLKY